MYVQIWVALVCLMILNSPVNNQLTYVQNSVFCVFYSQFAFYITYTFARLLGYKRQNANKDKKGEKARVLSRLIIFVQALLSASLVCNLQIIHSLEVAVVIAASIMVLSCVNIIINALIKDSVLTVIYIFIIISDCSFLFIMSTLLYV
jgi:hypothetical protein